MAQAPWPREPSEPREAPDEPRELFDFTLSIVTAGSRFAVGAIVGANGVSKAPHLKLFDTFEEARAFARTAMHAVAEKFAEERPN